MGTLALELLYFCIRRLERGRSRSTRLGWLVSGQDGRPEYSFVASKMDSAMIDHDRTLQFVNPTKRPHFDPLNPQFDPLNMRQAISSYRLVIARQQAAKSAQEAARLRSVAERCRNAWKVWNGRDELHELAFGRKE